MGRGLYEALTKKPKAFEEEFLHNPRLCEVESGASNEHNKGNRPKGAQPAPHCAETRRRRERAISAQLPLKIYTVNLRTAFRALAIVLESRAGCMGDVGIPAKATSEIVSLLSGSVSASGLGPALPPPCHVCTSEEWCRRDTAALALLPCL